MALRDKAGLTAEQIHMGHIAAMGCICCRLLGLRQESKTDVHHVDENGQTPNDFLTIPLCHHGCHQGPLGVHGDKTYLRQLKMSQWDLLARVIADLMAPPAVTFAPDLAAF